MCVIAIDGDNYRFLFLLEMKCFPQAQHKALQVGARPSRPSYVPAHLPALPDPHTYIKTPVSSVN